MQKVFLGGTCNNSNWRNTLIPLLKINYFNPVVENWTPDKQAEEILQREQCDYCLYVITPRMEGVYAIAELVDDSNKRPQKTIACFLTDDEGKKFSFTTLRSLKAVIDLLKVNGVVVCESLAEVALYLNEERN